MLGRAAWVASLIGVVGLAFTSLHCSRTRVSGPAQVKGLPPTRTAPEGEQTVPVKDALPAQTPPAVRQTIIGVVKAAAPEAPEAATVEVDGVVYNVVKDENGKTVAREAKDRKAEIKGTVEEKNGAKWIAVTSAKLGPY
ncbi:MAG TPA: hypothetical protein VNE39_08445 [Planctomycetota bacterium]|nr:hypothetical protein [Planctomycetota bacterium]